MDVRWAFDRGRGFNPRAYANGRVSSDFVMLLVSVISTGDLQETLQWWQKVRII